MTSRWAAEQRNTLRLAFGGNPKGTDNDLLHLASKLARSRKPRPRLYQWCGTEDFLYQDNLTFRNHAHCAGLKVDYSEGPGIHEWNYWDAQIVKVLEWLGAEKLITN